MYGANLLDKIIEMSNHNPKSLSTYYNYLKLPRVVNQMVTLYMGSNYLSCSDIKSFTTPRLHPSSLPSIIAPSFLSALLWPRTPKAGAVSNSTENDTMGEADAMVSAEIFSQSGRSGRRNALPDLGINDVDVGAHKLAETFSNLDASGAPAAESNQTGSDNNAAPVKE